MAIAARMAPSARLSTGGARCSSMCCVSDAAANRRWFASIARNDAARCFLIDLAREYEARAADVLAFDGDRRELAGPILLAVRACGAARSGGGQGGGRCVRRPVFLGIPLIRRAGVSPLQAKRARRRAPAARSRRHAGVIGVEPVALLAARASRHRPAGGRSGRSVSVSKPSIGFSAPATSRGSTSTRFSMRMP